MTDPRNRSPTFRAISETIVPLEKTGQVAMGDYPFGGVIRVIPFVNGKCGSQLSVLSDLMASMVSWDNPLSTECDRCHFGHRRKQPRNSRPLHALLAAVDGCIAADHIGPDAMAIKQLQGLLPAAAPLTCRHGGI